MTNNEIRKNILQNYDDPYDQCVQASLYISFVSEMSFKFVNAIQSEIFEIYTGFIHTM